MRRQYKIQETTKYVICGRRCIENWPEFDRYGFLRDGSGGQWVCFSIGYKNFDVPGAVDNQNSWKIAKARKLKVGIPRHI
jgi:hypothetical protein